MSNTGITITKATYGVGSNAINVTKTLTSKIVDGKINITVSPDQIGVTDPAPNQTKTLTVTYSINGGSSITQSILDNNQFSINAPSAVEASGLEITKAVYGNRTNQVDVTNALQTLVKDGAINITVGYKALGVPNPNPNQQNVLEVNYLINGAQNAAMILDGQPFNVSAPPVDAPSNTTPTRNVVSVVGTLYQGLLTFVSVFLHFVSANTAWSLAADEYKKAAYLAGLVIPYFAFTILPWYTFFRRLFYTTDLVPA